MTEKTFDDKKATIAFGDLEIGDMFIYNECVRIKIKTVNKPDNHACIEANSVELGSGELLCRGKVEYVTYIADMQFIYEYGPFLELSER